MNIIDSEPDTARNENLNPDEDDPYACSNEQRKAVYALPDGSHILSTSWLRRGFQDSSRLNEFLLDYNLGFLPYLGGIFWAVFLLVQVLT